MVVRRERIADVVDEGTQHVLVVAAVAFSPGGRLQAVLEAIHGEAPVVVAEVAELLDDPVREGLLQLGPLAHDDHPVLLRGGGHVGERRPGRLV